jgi:ACS family tartrate transporter-like MFS transporter
LGPDHGCASLCHRRIEPPRRAPVGVAEAGFFPGIIFFLTLWFPASYRARIVAPISSFILNLEGFLGLHGRQWMFIIEARPAILMAFAVLYFLTDRPTGLLDVVDHLF